jgi:pimeloyl-ACP methyl ester carboxylesterase
MKKNLPAFCKIALSLFLLNSLLYTDASQAQNVIAFDGEKSTWHDGFTRYDFIMDDSTLAITPFKAPDGEHFGVKDPPPGKHRCIIIAPNNAAPGNPWSWQACYWDHQPQTEVELLHRGFYIVYISATATLAPGKQWDAWYKYLTDHGLSPKPEFVGMSRGGQYEFTWATAHPDKVTAIYADNPYIPTEILSKVGELARYDVPLIHVCGSFDPLYNFSTLPVEAIYQGFGARISVMVKEGFGHHPHSLRNPKIIADFMEQSFKETQPPIPDYAGKKAIASWFYSSNYSYTNFPSEGTYITCRGPVFVPAYRRYQVVIPGVESFTTIIAPKTPAPGNPWIFRADLVRRDDTVAFALLKKGYYIVTGAVPYNHDGPMPDQWNNVYKYLTGFGFSPKPVISGNGGAAGEAIAWAINNPDKVTAIYAVNPILKTKAMLKTMPIDTLAPLAKAGIPLLFVCGADDPSLNEQALVAQKRYKQLGGKITLIIKKGEAHYIPQGDLEAVAFIARQEKQ